jgi:hypothetical protein
MPQILLDSEQRLYVHLLRGPWIGAYNWVQSRVDLFSRKSKLWGSPGKELNESAHIDDFPTPSLIFARQHIR